MSIPAVAERPQYAHYWADDTTMNPTIVHIVAEHDDNTFDVELPYTGEVKQVHLHTLGRPHHVL